MPKYVVVGASRGIGAAVAEHLYAAGADVVAVSRSPSRTGVWIEADVSKPQGIARVLDAIGDQAIDALLYMGGIWEQGAFTDAYSFLDSPVDETLQVIAVNLTAPILLAQGLAINLSRSSMPRILLMGSMSGLPNTASPEVANTAAKFGLQGAAEALAISLKPLRITVSVINPDNVATSEVEDDIAEGRFDVQVPIPMADLLATVDYCLKLSAHSVPSTIALRQVHS
jgi:NAD(P)-dependent dehydrogenase (short-subunit alcohol dehydrogenase family)